MSTPAPFNFEAYERCRIHGPPNYEFRSARWGPGLRDRIAGINASGDDLARQRAAIVAMLRDPEAIEEHWMIQEA